MPKGKKKHARRSGGESGTSTAPSEDDSNTADDVSTYSATSEDRDSVCDEAIENGKVDDTSAQELFEEKLKDYIEGTTEKSVKGRITSLEGIRKALTNKFMFDFIFDRKDTITDCIARCLRKGKGEEQAIAAKCAALLCVQLGQDAEGTLSELRPIFLTIIADNSAAVIARSQSATALAICSFIASSEIDQITTVMESLSNIFRLSYRKGDKSIPTHSPPISDFHATALFAWSLLFSIIPAYLVDKYIKAHLARFPDLLNSADVDLRIAAGEAIALLYELAREQDEDFEGDDIEELTETLKTLATDGNKYRAKKDRLKQRSSFRDILIAVEEGGMAEMSVRFAKETLNIDSWVRRCQYQAFCQFLGSGMNHHLQDNELLREVFGLGAPIPITGVPIKKANKLERHLVNAAAFKARTKARAKHRDKRSITANGVY